MAATFGLFFLTMLNSYAQEECATMNAHKKLMRTNPEYRTQYEQSLTAKSANRDASTDVLTIYKIPVVIHVMHLGEAVGVGTNISDEQIYSAITSLNEAYRKKAGSIYDGTGADMGMEFCLAQKDPSGNATKGINRINASATGNYGKYGLTIDTNQIAIKALSKWDNTKYYNIWVVSEIDDNDGGYGVQGFAYFPGAPSYLDGAIMLYNGFGYDPEGTRNYTLKSYANKNITCIHELGHAFNLYHVFEGDDPNGDGVTTCPTAVNGCGSDAGDCCTDIPACVRSPSNCPTGNNTCTSPATSKDLYKHNYMDYSSDDCQNMFSTDQSTRARATLSSGSRASLVTTANLTACGCNSNTAPIPRFYASDYTPCPGGTVQFYDESINAPATYSWTFPGGTPQTSASQNPTVTYAYGGHFAVTLKVSSSGGQNNTLTKTTYISPDASVNLPFSESFESSFPPVNWSIVSDDDSTDWGINGSKAWQQRPVVGSGAGSAAAAMNFFSYQSNGGEQDDLVAPILNLQGITNPSLTFNVAYKYYGVSNTDSLLVLATTNCGASYTTLYRKGGLNLQTTTSTTDDFIPASTADWRQETVDLSSFAGQNVQLVFRAINGYGDNLYLDNINIVGVSGTPVANFVSSETIGVATNQVITFTNTSTGSITTYSWDFGADASPASANTAGPIDVSYSSNGSKTITLTVSGPNGTNTVIKTDFVTVATSIISPQSLESAGIKVYPNPTKDIVYISAANSQYVSAQVLDVLSNTVIAEQTKTGTADLEINLSGKPQGIYLLMIKTTQGSFGTRIVKAN
ncbi:MAG: C-terminal target protein [Chitinophagaceae bacterium]|nr:C-terminal target protein [Chitinophagaceae bacterium]